MCCGVMLLFANYIYIYLIYIPRIGYEDITQSSLNDTLIQFRIIIIKMVIFKCYFSRERIALSYKKWCEHRIRKNQQIKSIGHGGKSYLK